VKMATKLDLKRLDLTKLDLGKLDLNELRTEAQRGLEAGVGAADRAVAAVRGYVTESVAEAQKRFAAAQQGARDLDVKALREQATKELTARVEELTKDAKARRVAIEKRVAELQEEAQRFVAANVETAGETFDSLAKQGEKIVKRFRKDVAAVADPGPVSKTTGATTTAKKAPARKTAAKKVPAKKATAKKAPAKKAPVKKTTAKATTSK